MKMVKVNLKRSIGYRAPGAARATLYGPGEGVEMPELVAQALGIEAEGEVDPAAAAELRELHDAANSDEEEIDLEAMTLDELKALAKEEGVEVKRGDKKDGQPTKADYVKALGS
jgi:hypothetical protein